jgi:hypothetical protein
VIAQCKAEKKKGPGRVRELEGVVFRLASESGGGGHQGYGVYGAVALAGRDNGNEEKGGFRRTPIVALPISSSSFTKAAVLRARSSPIPMPLLHLPLKATPPSGSLRATSIKDTTTTATRTA